MWSTADELNADLYRMECSLIEDYRSVGGAAAEAERIAVSFGRADLAQRARLLSADLLCRSRGDLAVVGRIAREVNLWAQEHGHRYLLARSHRQLSSFYRRVGDSAEALTHAVQCVRYSDEDMPPRLRAGHLTTLALVLDINGAQDEASRRFTEALRIADATGDGYLRLLVLNNMAYTAYENRDAQTALELVDRMRATERAGCLLDAQYLDTIARVYLLLGRYAEVAETLRPVVSDPGGPRVTEPDAVPECLLTLAEAQRLGGDLDRAQATLDEARRLCDVRALAGLGVQVRIEQASLFADAGDYRAAYEEHRRFHRDAEALRSAEREARARAMHAVFETDEARRTSERFREMAMRDPLTGLYNRRYVDDHLPAAIESAVKDGTPVSVALVDLDFFKRVNDTLSHEAGDTVLRVVGTLLVDGIGSSDVAVRLGGEEFALFLPGADTAAAFARCESVRQLIRGYGWEPVTGPLPVTASIGVTTCVGSPITASALLARADRNLYAAKRTGRDRVVGDGGYDG